MAGSLSSGSINGYNRATGLNQRYFVNRCNCGDELNYSVSRTDKNPGRKFKACPNYMNPDKKGCKYFKWLDPPLTMEEFNDTVGIGLLQMHEVVGKVIHLLRLMLVVMGLILAMLLFGLGMLAKW